jgi:nucleosome binding factor SPN SPT16 subunit
VPHRQQALLQPTTDCLVQLTELPFLVITLSDVEIVHLERINFGLKNFDVVFVFKNFKQPVVHVNSVPVNQLEAVKEWLDSVDICFTEGPVNLSWPQIMKTVNDDPAAFFNEGGWSFLHPTGGDEEEDEEEEVSEFEMATSEVEGTESESDASMGTESESDDYSGSGSGSEGEEESEGEDWDELERKAAEKDAKKARSRDYSDDERPKKHKR